MSRRRRANEAAFSLFAFQDIITSVTGIMILLTLILALELLQRVEGSPRARTAESVRLSADAMASVSQVQSIVQRNEARIRELREKLAQGAIKIDELAEFDRRGVAQDVADMQQIDQQLAHQLESLQDKLDKSSEQLQDVQRQSDAINTEQLKELLGEVERKKQELEKLKNRVIFNPVEDQGKRAWLIEMHKEGFTVAATGVSAPPESFQSRRELLAWMGKLDQSRDYFVLLIRPDGVTHYHKIRADLDNSGFDLGIDLLSGTQVVIDPEVGAAPR